jgi:hypothetical protein
MGVSTLLIAVPADVCDGRVGRAAAAVHPALRAGLRARRRMGRGDAARGRERAQGLGSALRLGAAARRAGRFPRGQRAVPVARSRPERRRTSPPGAGACRSCCRRAGGDRAVGAAADRRDAGVPRALEKAAPPRCRSAPCCATLGADARGERRAWSRRSRSSTCRPRSR